MARKPRTKVYPWANNLDAALNERFVSGKPFATSYNIFIERMVTEREDGQALRLEEQYYIAGYMRALKDCGALS